jgi:hypothetical protein
LSQFYATTGRFADAIDEVGKATVPATASKATPSTLDAKGYIEKTMEITGADRSGAIAVAYAAAGDRDKAIEYLQKGYSDGDDILLWIRYPVFDSMRSDPRYAGLLRRLGVPE